MPYFIRSADPGPTTEMPRIEPTWRDFLDASPSMLWISDTAGRLVHVNAAWQQATGHLPGDISPEQTRGLVHPADRAILLPVIADRHTREFRLRQADGTYRWVLENIHAWRDAGGGLLGFIGSAIDIHLQKEHERSLTLIALRQTALTQFSRVLLEERTLADVSREGLRVFYESLSLPAALLLMKSGDEQSMGIVAHEGFEAGALPTVKPAANPGAGGVLELPDDHAAFPLDAESLGKLGWLGGFAVPIHPRDAQAGYFVGLYPAPESPGQAELHHARHLAGLLSAAYERDHARRQLALSEQRALQTQKIEAVSHFAGRIGHDFNNLLTPIRCFAELLRDELSDEAQITKLNDILEASSRAGGLVRQLHALSRQEMVLPDPPAPTPETSAEL